MSKQEIELISSRYFGLADMAVWDWDPPVEYQKEGANPGWTGSAVTQSGWYILPFCDPGCCRPRGPFESEREAILASRNNVVEKLNDGPPANPDLLQKLISE